MDAPWGVCAVERQYRDRQASGRARSDSADGRFNLKLAWFAGVDWGSQKHQVCVLDADGKVLGEREFEHSGAGLTQMADWLLSFATGDAGEVSRPGESHPRALAELYVNVSAHTAPIIQPPVSPPADANGRTAGARDEQGHRASDWRDGDVAVAFCISAWPIEPTGH